MEMENVEVLKVLFQTHHAQLMERRRKIHAITERTVAVLIVVAGWLVLSSAVPSLAVRSLLIAAAVLIAVASCRIQYKNALSYKAIAGVICKLNHVLGLFEKGKYCPGEALYPDSWINFGQEPAWRTVILHWAILIGMTAVCIVAAVLR